MARMLLLVVVFAYCPVAVRGAELTLQLTVDANLADFKQFVHRQRSASERAVATYRPAIDRQIDRAGMQIDSLLRGLPGVEKVGVASRESNSNKCIVHIKDWHYLPKELFAADIRSSTSEPISDDEVSKLYERHLLEVELVQHEQMALLRCLIRHHGLRHVFCEGLAKEDLVIYEAKLRVLRRVRHDVASLRQQLDAAREKHSELTAAGQDNSNEVQDLIETIEKLEKVLIWHRHEQLRIGAVGRLLLNNELRSVLPLEELVIYQKSNPLSGDNRVRLNRKTIEDREDAQVRNMLRRKGVSVVVLGGAHDLANNVRRVTNVDCSYIKVTTQSYQRIAE